jgi:hypothetical protein
VSAGAYDGFEAAFGVLLRSPGVSRALEDDVAGRVGASPGFPGAAAITVIRAAHSSLWGGAGSR